MAESSSVPPSPEPANENGNDLPEIGESQQSPITDSTLSSTPEDLQLQTPQTRTREPTVQVPDPPSSFDRGAYHKVDPRSSSNGTGNVDSSVPLPTISEVEVSSPQHGEDETATRVVPDSQSQGQFLIEDSTFRGFSPTQLQRTNGIEDAEQSPEADVDVTATAPRATPFVNSELQIETQASGGAERNEGAEQDSAEGEAVKLNEISAGSGIATERSGNQNSSDPAQTEALNSVLVQSAHSDVQPPSAKTSPSKQRSATPQTNSQEQTLSVAHEQQLEESDSEINSQEESPVRVNTRASFQLDNYIVISAEDEDEDDPPSTLGLLTQPEYNPPPAGQRPPPSSLVSENVPQPTRADNISNPNHRIDATFASTQSSFPFETQQPFPTKIENESRPRAIFTPRIASPRSSSQIPSIPSQSLLTIGESAPARLVTPSPTSTAAATAPATMESTSSNSVNPLLAKLNAMTDSSKARRAARRSNTPAAASNSGHAASALPPNISAEVVASQARHGNGGRSPSAVPASEPERNVSKEEMRTSGRLPSLVALPHGVVPEDPDALTVSGGLKTSQDSPEEANVHAIPIAFGNIQRDQYKNGFQWYKGEIQGFLDGDDSPERFSKAETALNELRDIAIHPDLINSEACSQPLSTPEQAQWDVDASCKFCFLGELLDRYRFQEDDVHIAVAAKGHVIPEMLENFLQANGVSHTRLAVEIPTAGASGLRVSVVDLETDVPIDRMERADVVLVIDGACNTQDPMIQATRRAGRDNDWAPLLILVAPCTVEHIERSLLPSIADTTRVRTLLKTALKLQLQGVAGKLTPSQASSKDAAIAVAGFLAGPNDWTIEELGTIENLDSQTETDIDQTMNGDGDSFSGGKRSLDADVDTLMGNPAKKPRGSSVEVVEGQVNGTMPATINPQDIEITHISDSIGKATQSALDDFSSMSELEQLRRILSEKQDELHEHVKAMSDLQYRHEEQHVELAKTKNERDEAIMTAQNAVTRMSVAANQSAELRIERTALKELLAEANSKLLSHAIPERREFETLRLAMEQEKLAKEKAEKRLEQAQKDSEYSRELYQNTSSQARELVQQNTDLEARLEIAERLAAGEQVKVQQATAAGRDKLLVKENQKLKTLLQDREAGMKFKDEEIARLKEAGRGRMGTRGSSVPRSPRMGSPALKGRSSRQTSPAMGEVVKGKHLHPLRQG